MGLSQLVIGRGRARPWKPLLLALRDHFHSVVDLVRLADRGRALGGHEASQRRVVAAERAGDRTRQLRPHVGAQVEVAKRGDREQSVDGDCLRMSVRVVDAGLQRMGVEAVEQPKCVPG